MPHAKGEPRIFARNPARLQSRLRNQATVQFRSAAELSMEAAERLDALEGAFLGLTRAVARYGPPTPAYMMQLMRHLEIPLDETGPKPVPLPLPEKRQTRAGRYTPREAAQS